MCVFFSYSETVFFIFFEIISTQFCFVTVYRCSISFDLIWFRYIVMHDIVWLNWCCFFSLFICFCFFFFSIWNHRLQNHNALILEIPFEKAHNIYHGNIYLVITLHEFHLLISNFIKTLFSLDHFFFSYFHWTDIYFILNGVYLIENDFMQHLNVVATRKKNRHGMGK